MEKLSWQIKALENHGRLSYVSMSLLLLEMPVELGKLLSWLICTYSSQLCAPSTLSEAYITILSQEEVGRGLGFKGEEDKSQEEEKKKMSGEQMFALPCR